MPGLSTCGARGPRAAPRALAQASVSPARRIAPAPGSFSTGLIVPLIAGIRVSTRRASLVVAFGAPSRLASSPLRSAAAAGPLAKSSGGCRLLFPRASARRARATRAAAAGSARSVVVRIQRSVPFGHSVRLVGEGDAFGSWDPSRAPALTWSEGDVWEGGLSLGDGSSASVACKAVELDADGRAAVWEDGANRELPVGGGVAAVSFAWNDPAIKVQESGSAQEGQGAEEAQGAEGDGAKEAEGGAPAEDPSSGSAASLPSDLDPAVSRSWVGSAPKLMQSNEHSRERPAPPSRETIERLPAGSAARLIAEGDLEAASWLDKLGVVLEVLETGDAAKAAESSGSTSSSSSSSSSASSSAIPIARGPATPSASTVAAARLYLEWIASGAVPCVESGGHYRPNHHAELSMKAFLLLERATEAGMREEEESGTGAGNGAGASSSAPVSSFEVPPPPLGPSARAVAARAAAVRLPGFSAALRQTVPLTSIRDLAHRNDIPHDLKLELKHTLQNKLHRNAGPEDIVVAEEIMRRLRRARDIKRRGGDGGEQGSEAGASFDVDKYGNVSDDFFEAYESFMRELRDFFSATSLLDCLDEAAESLPSEGDRALVRRVRPALGVLERAEHVCREAEGNASGGAATNAGNGGRAAVIEDLQAEGQRESAALALTLRTLGGLPGGVVPGSSSSSSSSSSISPEGSPHDPTPGKGLLQYIMDALHATTSARAAVLAALQSGVRPSATPEALSNRHRLRVAECLAEQQAFALLSRFCNRLDEAGGAEAIARGTDAAWALPTGALVLALRHAALGGGLAPAEAHAVECELAAWQQAGGFADPRGDAARRLLATLGRVQRLAGRYAEASLAAYGALARDLGPALGVPPLTYQVFSEAEVRASVLFQAAKIAATLARACRLACGAPSAEALVGGDAVGVLLQAPNGLEPDCIERAIEMASERMGKGSDAPELASLLRSASNRVVLAVPFASGDEELGGLVRRPAGEPRLAGTVLGQELPHLSHLGVRARQERLPFVLFPDDVERQTAVDPLVGGLVRLEASEAPKLTRATAEESMENESSAAAAGAAAAAAGGTANESGKDSRPTTSASTAPPSPLAATPLKPEVSSRPAPVPLSAATRSTCGAKASSCGELVRLSARLGGFAAPDGLALPYGTLEHLARKNRVSDQLEALLDAIDAENDAIKRAEEARIEGGDDALPDARKGKDTQQTTAPSSSASSSSASSELRRLVLSLRLPREWLASISRHFPAGSALMVRSSANVEDLAGMSGAGLYDSVRNVPSGDVAAIERAVCEVLASLWSERACGARRTAGVRARDAHMAVAVQAQLPADVCFVLHTAHPGIPGALEAELAVGHGETLAAGTRGTPWRLRVEGHKTQQNGRQEEAGTGSKQAKAAAEEAGKRGAEALEQEEAEVHRSPESSPESSESTPKATVTTESFANFSLAYVVPARHGKSFSPPADAPPAAPIAVPVVVDYSRQLLSVEREARQALGRALGAIGAALEDHFGGPQDVEGILVGKTVYIVQTRPQPM